MKHFAQSGDRARSTLGAASDCELERVARAFPDSTTSMLESLPVERCRQFAIFVLRRYRLLEPRHALVELYQLFSLLLVHFDLIAQLVGLLLKLVGLLLILSDL